MDSLWALFDKDLEEGGRRAFFPLCLQLLSTWLLMTERKWIKMSYLNWKSATEQKRFTLPNPSVTFTRKRKRRHHWFICTVILGGLFFQSCTFEHLEHLWKAIWFSGRFTSHPVCWKLFTPHLLAWSTLSTEQSYENTIDTAENMQVALQEMWAVWNCIFGSAFIWMVQPMFYFKLQLFPYFV